METITNKWKGIVKAYKHYMHPNDNPTEQDKIAFDLLNKGQVDQFIDYSNTHPVNIHVHDFTAVNFLIKAQDVANDNHPCKKLLSEQQRMNRAIKASLYLIQRGIDINYQDKSGRTALIAAVHWQNVQLAQLLLKKGADPNLGTQQNGQSNRLTFNNLPLISALFKNNFDLVIMLISYGAETDLAFKLFQENKNGFNISIQQQNLLRTASNLQIIIRKRRYEIALGKQTVLSMLSEAQFQEICFYV